MISHDHIQPVAGCFRCELSADEARDDAPPGMLYVERMIATTQMLRCDQCQRLIRWPEEMRVYAPTLNDRPTRIEHVSHTPLTGAKEVTA